MPSSVTAANVMLRSAALLNDGSQVTFTNTVLLPYLQMAYDELGEKLEENNVPATNETSAALVVTTAMTDIGGSTGPALPSDLIDIQKLWERDSGVTTQDWQEMTRVDFLPGFTTLTESLSYWTWQNQQIKFIGATSNRDVRIDYVGLTLGAVSSANSPIALFNAKNFLACRCAALAAQFIGENKSRSDDLNGIAGAALDRLLNIATKGRQAIATRRRPFMARYKISGGW